MGTSSATIIPHPATTEPSIIDLCAALTHEADALARLATQAQGYVKEALVAVTCVGCGHPKHVALRCSATTAITHEPCGCDLHFGLWPDQGGHPGRAA